MEDNSQKLSDAIHEMIEAYGLKARLSEATLLESWNRVVGEMISRHTKDLHIRKKKLFVTVDSPALKNELIYSRSVLLEKLNEAAGGQVIEEIVFL